MEKPRREQSDNPFKAIEIVTKAILTGDPFIFIGQLDENQTAVMMHSNDAAVSVKLAGAMSADKFIADVVLNALMLYTLRESLEDFKPNCEACKKKDNCDIRSRIEAGSLPDEGCSVARDLLDKLKKEGRQ